MFALFFSSPVTCACALLCAAVEQYQNQLLTALEEDGKTLPARIRDHLKLDKIVDVWNVQYAIGEMASHKMAGEDGIPADWFKIIGARVRAPPRQKGTKDQETDPTAWESQPQAPAEEGDSPSALAKLLSAAFIQIYSDGVAPTGMRNAIVSLLYKEKGIRSDLKHYRPIAVANAVTKILEKAMVLSIRPLVRHLVSPDQKAFQSDKYIAENTQLVQDLIEYCNQNNLGGFLLFCDQDSAYPRVEWDFMSKVMRTMKIHEDFIKMVEIMYANATLQIKVNSHIGEAFHPTNSVAQGSPLSPILYLLVIQSFISLIDTSPELQGVAIPGPGGDEQRPHIHKGLVFADDVLLSLKDEDQLVPFKKLLHIYEHGTGAKNSWPKTHGLRVGALRESTYLSAGWMKGRDINTDTTLIKYLGIFLGVPEETAQKWITSHR